jgi:hypothetical protein
MVNYEHVRCKCGGIIGIYNREIFTCERCGVDYVLHKLDYDVCWTNNKTGWIFPIKLKRGDRNEEKH